MKQTETLTELSSFHYSFQITKKIVFEVNYYRLGSNKNKHFSTSAAQFNQRKTDFNHCGQAQSKLLKEGRTAMQFYKKWDHRHLNDLTEQEHAEILADIEALKKKYNFTQTDTSATFSQLRELSMQKITIHRTSK
jgi:hypothetical protein